MKKLNRLFQNDNIGLLFVLPAFIYMLLFVGYPIISNIILSLQDVTVRTLRSNTKVFVGLTNYNQLFQTDNVLITSIRNTLVFTVMCIVFQFLIGFALALFFNKRFSFSKPIRGLILMPWMIPITISGLMFKFMFGTDVGIINFFLRCIGIISENIDWLTNPTTAMTAVIIANIWIGVPFNLILISAGLTIVPTELYESASIDGAGKLQSFFRITLPMLKSTIESVLILGFIYTFKVYDLIYVMTSGGPVNATQLLSTYSYKYPLNCYTARVQL